MSLSDALVGPSDSGGGVAVPCARLAAYRLGGEHGRVQEGDQPRHLEASSAHMIELSMALGDGQTLPLHPWVHDGPAVPTLCSVDRPVGSLLSQEGAWHQADVLGSTGWLHVRVGTG